MEKFRFLIVIFIFALFIFNFAPMAQAVSFWPLVPCGLNAQPTDSSGVELPKVPTQENPDAHDYTLPCNQCDLLKLFKNIIDFVLIGLMPPAAAILFVWGGFLILMGGANPGWITQGKSIFWNTAIGVAIILASWLITNTIIRSVAADNVAPEWWKFECRVTTTESPSPTLLSISATLSLSDAIQGTVYSANLIATGGTTPYTWTISQGSLPTGLNLNASSGVISGTPTTVGTSNFTVRVQDSTNPAQAVTKQLIVRVVATSAGVTISGVASSNITNTGATITWTTNRAATSQVAYGSTTAYGQATTATANQVTNHSVNITGLSSGTTYNYQAVSSVANFTARSANYTFRTTGTSGQTLSITTATLSNATVGQAYSATLAGTGGQTPYRWAVYSGSLPMGLTLNPTTGVIFGTPTVVGTVNFQILLREEPATTKSSTKNLSIVVGGTTGSLTCGQSWEKNLCQSRSMTCTASPCSQYVTAINQYAGGSASANFLKAVMIKESACNISADSGHAYGLMQLVPSTANIYKSRCGVTENITSTWLKTSTNASASICIAAEYIRALSSTSCGNTPRNIAAGYNGGSGACNNSISCAGDTSCDSSPVKKWECLYDNPQRNVCNTGYAETRDYATKVVYCYNNPGF